jgi:large subunit ribosomal protein L23
MTLKPITTEKAVKMIELDNTLMFEIDRRTRKPELKKEIESLFSVKVEKIRTFIRHNKKFAYVKLNKKNPAIDIATKLGMM